MGSKEYEYPIIARIARDYLAIPATSATSKSVFSIGGDIITKKREQTRRRQFQEATMFTGLGCVRGEGGGR